MGQVVAKQDEQILVENFSKAYTINGPKVVMCSKCTHGPCSQLTVRKALTLSNDSYCVLTNKMTGTKRVVKGPTLMFMEAEEEVKSSGIQKATRLGNGQYCKVTDTNTAQERVETGPTLLFPAENEVVGQMMSAILLREQQYLKVNNTITGECKMIRGPQSYIPAVDEQVHGVQTALVLSNREYCFVSDSLTGDVKAIRGPCSVFPDVNDSVGPKRSAIPLQSNQFVHIVNEMSGERRCEVGEQLVWLGPQDKVVQGPRDGYVIDQNRAVLVRERKTGQLHLVTEPQVFVPSAMEEIVEERAKIHLESYQACVIKDRVSGNLKYTRGPTSFFLLPYEELLTQSWSSGSGGLDRTSKFTVRKFDTRPHFMAYKFGSRTRDNVEINLEVTFFWGISDVMRMVETTSDPPGDLCSHARSSIIEAVSRLTLEEFLASFNQVAAAAVLHEEAPDLDKFRKTKGEVALPTLESSETESKGLNFYEGRGLDLKAVEVRSITCRDPRTQETLNNIIQEQTNRINKLQQAESQNEVNLVKFKGQIDSQKLEGKLLDMQIENARKQGQIEGQGEAWKVKSFMDALADTVTSEDARLALFENLRKGENVKNLASGNVKMIFTPQDVGLKIQM